MSTRLGRRGRTETESTHYVQRLDAGVNAALELGWADADAEERRQIIEFLSLYVPERGTDASASGRLLDDRNTP
jgi:hypothetical protein